MAKTSVLIVEDEKIVALDIRKQLEKSGYRVCGVYGSGEEALEFCESASPDIVLMDIQLQGKMDGVATAKEMRAVYEVPVIFLTAYADDATIERAKFIEPFGYLPKPFDEKSLRTTIEMALYKSKIDRELQKSEEKYRSFFEEDLSGDFICGPDGKILDCNTAFKELFKFPAKNEALNADINAYFPDKKAKDNFWDLLKKQKKVKLKELQFRTCTGELITVLANIIATVRDGAINEVKGYFIDETARKELEEQLRHAQKMEAIGRLAGGVAHDFNNILTVMLGYTSVLRDKVEEGEELSGEIESLKSSIKRAVKLTKQLLLFSRREVLNPQVLDINNLTLNLEKMLGRLISEHITLKVYLDANNPFIFIDPGQMEQVLINLVVNARDAMHEGGRVTIHTENVTIDEPETAVNGIIKPGKYVKISVEDTGHGIDQENVRKIFEPFFTTKPQEEGTGLGLATVYGIVNQSEGFIKITTKIGKGTMFSLFFTERKQEEQVPARPVEAEDNRAAGETVLIVEDDENVRNVTGDILRRKGYTILEAKNGGEAILICEKSKESIDLVLSDYVLPFLNGDEMAERLLQIIPELKFVFMSANLNLENEIRLLGGEPVRVLRKPFEAEELAGTVRKTLDT
jgi:two-component system, cell cycle sensor histidine kinase and response regulator CckA